MAQVRDRAGRVTLASAPTDTRDTGKEVNIVPSSLMRLDVLFGCEILLARVGLHIFSAYSILINTAPLHEYASQLLPQNESIHYSIAHGPEKEKYMSTLCYMTFLRSTRQPCSEFIAKEIQKSACKNRCGKGKCLHP